MAEISCCCDILPSLVTKKAGRIDPRQAIMDKGLIWIKAQAAVAGQKQTVNACTAESCDGPGQDEGTRNVGLY